MYDLTTLTPAWNDFATYDLYYHILKASVTYQKKLIKYGTSKCLPSLIKVV